MVDEAPTRTDAAAQHLHLLRALARELERAMDAIAANQLTEFEESIASQQALSWQLGDVAGHFRASALEPQASCEDSIEPGLKSEIRDAARELQQLNLQYAALIKHSSQSVAMMTSLFNSFRGQFQEASSARPRYRALSGRMVTSWEA